MKQHHIRETTPLKYHRFFHFICIPVSILYSLAGIGSLLSQSDPFTWMHRFLLISYCLDTALLTCSFIGFFRWRPYAWKSIMVFFCCRFLINILLLLFFKQTTATISQFLAGLCANILTGIYYIKRRPLFTKPIDFSPHTFCCKCENKLSPNDRFCGKCGQIVQKE